MEALEERVSLLLALLAMTMLTLVRYAVRSRAERISNLLARAAGLVGLLFMLVQPFVIQVYYVPTKSMEPTLMPGDFVLGLKRTGRLAHGDLVVVEPPRVAGDRRLHIKRVVGLPGDVVQVIQGRLFRNGRAVAEPYLRDRGVDDFKLVQRDGATIPVRIGKSGLANYDSDVVLPFAIGWDRTKEVFVEVDRLDAEQTRAILELKEAPAAPVPPGYLLVFGDNRPGSFDSRQWGLVAESSVAARVTAVVFPFFRAEWLP